jgi:hypothetical protein
VFNCVLTSGPLPFPMVIAPQVGESSVPMEIEDTRAVAQVIT